PASAPDALLLAETLLEEALLEEALLDTEPPVPCAPPPEDELPFHSSRPRIWAQAAPLSTAGATSHGKGRDHLSARWGLPAVPISSPFYEPVALGHKPTSRPARGASSAASRGALARAPPIMARRGCPCCSCRSRSRSCRSSACPPRIACPR